MAIISDKIDEFLLQSYQKYYNTISLNKNLLISGTVGFLSSIIIAHFSVQYSLSYVLNSALTVITGFLTYKIIFAILFHLDNKQKYTKRFSRKINFHALRQIMIKMIFASSIFDIVNNLTRFFLLIQLLKLDYSAIEAAAFSSLIASLLSYGIINLIVRYIHLFSQKR